MTAHKWTTHEIKYLKRAYGKKSVAAMAERLGLTRQAVVMKLYSHGISKPSPRTDRQNVECTYPITRYTGKNKFCQNPGKGHNRREYQVEMGCPKKHLIWVRYLGHKRTLCLTCRKEISAAGEEKYGDRERLIELRAMIAGCQEFLKNVSEKHTKRYNKKGFSLPHLVRSAEDVIERCQQRINIITYLQKKENA